MPDETFPNARHVSHPMDRSHPRLGIPDDKTGTFGTPLRTEIEGEVRHAVVLMLFPPTALRDASREVIEHVVRLNGDGYLKAIADEIYRSYTSDPVDAASTRNIGEMLTKHADLMARGD